MKYKVIRDCHFSNRYWHEGEIAEFPDVIQPNHHFEVLNKQEGIYKKDVVKVIPDPQTMSQINDERKQNMPKTGMAYQNGANGEVAAVVKPQEQATPNSIEPPRKRGRPPRLK